MDAAGGAPVLVQEMPEADEGMEGERLEDAESGIRRLERRFKAAEVSTAQLSAHVYE